MLKKRNLKKRLAELGNYETNAYLSKKLYEHIKTGFNVMIDLSEIKTNQLSVEGIDNLISKAKELNLPLRLYVSGYSQFGKEKQHAELNFDQESLNTMISLNNYLVSNEQEPLRFLESSFLPEEAWSLEQVLNANKKIDEVIETIRQNNFTPFEAMACIHYYITSHFAYFDDKKNPNNSRSITGVFNSDSIVCVGYANLTKAIIDKLNMPGLEAKTFDSIYKFDTEKFPELKGERAFMHVQNLIKINDPKYNVKGTYVNDSCWDAKDLEFTNGKGFANFMIPVEDLFHVAGRKFTQIDHLKDGLALEVLRTGKEISREKMPITKEIKNSKPIPYVKYDLCIDKMLRKLHPDLPFEKVTAMSDKTMMRSSQFAAAFYDEEATGAVAKLGHQVLEKLGRTKKKSEPTQLVR